MPSLLTKLTHLFNAKPNKPRPCLKVIITAIGMPSYQLAKALQEQEMAEIIGFIDHEPWTNRTQLLGATIHYPSNMTALISKYKVALVIEVTPEIKIKESVWQDVHKTSAKHLTVDTQLSLTDQISLVRQFVAQA